MRSLINLVGVLAVAACSGAPAPTPSAAPSAAHTAAPTPGATASAGVTDSAILGSWQTSITKADLEAAGFNDPGLLNENSGMFTWTYEPDGTWSQVQLSLDGSPIASPVFRGTYSFNGDELVMVTTFPPDYRDNGLRYDWSIEGDTLTLDLLNQPDPVLPVIVETHPWTRASE